METHPIPQDVTGFQFKLVGNMTVRQFAYLASGSITAWIFFSIGISPFIKLPIAFLSAISGVSLAFLPIEGRPMDTMMLHFIKALYAPNQFFYQKQSGQFTAVIALPAKTAPVSSPLSQKDIQAYINKMPKKPRSRLDEKETIFFTTLAAYSQPVSQGRAEHPTSPPSTYKPHLISMKIEEEKNKPKLAEPIIIAQNPASEEQLEKETVALKQELEEAKKEEVSQKPQQAEVTHQRVGDLEKQLAEIMAQKQQLEQQFIALSQKFQAQQQVRPVFTPSTPPVTQSTPNVRSVPKGLGAKIGLPITSDNPNLIVGIIKDPRGNILPNILVEVKDTEGNPVRAFKTNNLGQFASATSLLNGVYTLEFEDPSEKNKFDKVEITASGQVIPPLEVFSSDEREKLRKELFGQ